MWPSMQYWPLIGGEKKSNMLYTFAFHFLSPLPSVLFLSSPLLFCSCLHAIWYLFLFVLLMMLSFSFPLWTYSVLPMLTVFITGHTRVFAFFYAPAPGVLGLMDNHSFPHLKKNNKSMFLNLCFRGKKKQNKTCALKSQKWKTSLEKPHIYNFSVLWVFKLIA